jgi:hypothetical protein
MENKIVIAIATLMVVALAAPVVMAVGEVEYSATVGSGQNTAVTIIDAGFGTVTAGSTGNEIGGSLTLTKTGNVAASVSAAFTTVVDSIYGLTDSTNVYVIGGSNFKIGVDTKEAALDDTVTPTALGLDNNVPANGAVNYDAILDVPAGQYATAYAGTVQLTFS